MYHVYIFQISSQHPILEPSIQKRGKCKSSMIVLHVTYFVSGDQPEMSYITGLTLLTSGGDDGDLSHATTHHAELAGFKFFPRHGSVGSELVRRGPELGPESVPN